MSGGLVIAIDGPAGSGKSSTARAVAERLGLAHLDSGALYRSLTFAALDNGEPFLGENLAALARSLPVDLKLEVTGFVPKVAGRNVVQEIRSADVNSRVSEVAALAEVRDWVNEGLRRAAATHPLGVVVDGRDIGTVVFPDAGLKIYLTASDRVRAIRRLREMGMPEDAGSVDDMIREIARRDRADSSREVAPLRKASDAVELDTSELTFEDQVDRIAVAAQKLLDSG